MAAVPSTVTVPDVWPILPIIAVNRHPVFPKFIKIIEIQDENLMEIVRRKVKLNQPYCGIFVKRDDENTEEVVESLADLYSTGTFAQIVELQDLGKRLRMVLMAHRRIKIIDQVKEEPLPQEELDKKKNVELELTPYVKPLRKRKDGIDDERIFLGETENVKQRDFETTEEVSLTN